MLVIIEIIPLNVNGLIFILVKFILVNIDIHKIHTHFGWSNELLM